MAAGHIFPQNVFSVIPLDWCCGEFALLGGWGLFAPWPSLLGLGWGLFFSLSGSPEEFGQALLPSSMGPTPKEVPTEES